MSNRSDTGRFLKDGNLAFSGGQDGGRDPSDLDRDQVALAVNCTMRGGNCKPRPGWKQRKLTFANGTKTTFETGFFQNAGCIYTGDTFNALLSSHGGRQFKIDIDATPTSAVTTADFVIPAASSNVAVSVITTNNLQSQAEQVNIGGKPFTFVSIDSLTQITIRNETSDNDGDTVTSGSLVVFPATWSVTEISATMPADTETGANFNIPAVGATVSVTVTNTATMTTQLPMVEIGGYQLILISVDSSTTITVQNNIIPNAGVFVASGAVVNFDIHDLNNPNNRLNWSIQAENYWILQDNQAYPLIFDGSMTVRSDPAKKQIPVGNVMCYTQGRISVALPDRETYRVGDLLFGASSTSFLSKDAILYFTENDYLNEGGDLVARVFGAPSASGDILAMKAAAMTDQSLGQGPMLVGTPNVVFSVNLPFDRTTWANLANAMQTANPIKGPSGQNSTVLINTDLWYRSNDGIRSYKQAQRQFNGSWGNTSQSFEVNEIIKNDTGAWLEFGSGALFDNRLLMTCSPQMTPRGCYHRGLVVLDFDLTTSIRKTEQPAWEGMWEGLRILQIVGGIVDKVERCFIYALNDDAEIELWELTKNERFDDGNVKISWSPTTASYNCGDSNRLKKLRTARYLIEHLWGDLEIITEFRADETACWIPWHTATVCAKNEDCDPVCPGPVTYRDQTRYVLRLPEPPDTGDDISGRPCVTGFEHQLRLRCTGYGELKQIRIFCDDQPEMLGIEKAEQT